jgi:hypothetical protein
LLPFSSSLITKSASPPASCTSSSSPIKYHHIISKPLQLFRNQKEKLNLVRTYITTIQTLNSIPHRTQPSPISIATNQNGAPPHSTYAELLSNLKTRRNRLNSPLAHGQQAWQRTELQHIVKIGILAARAGLRGENVLSPDRLWRWITREFRRVANGKRCNLPPHLFKHTLELDYVELAKAALALTITLGQ